MNTVSGIEPNKVLQLVRQILNYQKLMNDVLNDIQGRIGPTVRGNYEGQAAEAMLQKINTQSARVNQELTNIIKTLDKNINEDLDDTRRTDVNLSR